MEFKELTRQNALNEMKIWQEDKQTINIEDKAYETIRNDVLSFIESSGINPEKDKYDFDAKLGYFIYDYFNKLPGFSVRQAANDGFWRYISVKVMPDVIEKRWGDSEDYFWKNPTRVYFARLWWYIHLSWQGDEALTKEVISSPNCTTDTILNLEERTGRNGTFINVYRTIMYFYSRLSASELSDLDKKYKDLSGSKSETFFRAVMRLNTAKVMIIEPELCLGGELEYVRSLFKELGVNV